MPVQRRETSGSRVAQTRFATRRRVGGGAVLAIPMAQPMSIAATQPNGARQNQNGGVNAGSGNSRLKAEVGPTHSHICCCCRPWFA